MKKTTTILGIIGVILVANWLSNQFFFRFDLTENKEYTMSNATKTILKGLEEPIKVKAYFSENLPPVLDKLQKEFEEKLVEYSNISKGNIEFEFVNPDDSDDLKQEAGQAGIPAVPVQVREKDQVQVKNTYLGAILEKGETKEVIQAIQPGEPLEYMLTTAIKKISVVAKPSIGIVQGHGETPIQELKEVYQGLSVLYNVENLNLDAEETIPARFKTIAIVAPKDTFLPTHLKKLDDYLAQGGNLFIGINRAEGNFQTSQITSSNTGLETWLDSKGILVEDQILTDANCGRVNVTQQSGFMTFQTAKQFPYFPAIKTFYPHPVTKGIEEVVMPIASSIIYKGDTTSKWTPLAFTSAKTGIMSLPNFFNINKNWGNNDFIAKNLVVGGVLEGSIVGQANSRIIVFGDGDFPSQSSGRGQSNNGSLMVNSIDWLSDDTGLIELRTKSVSTRPIEDLEDSKRSIWKYVNFLLPIVLVIGYGIFRSSRQRRTRMKRMQESYI